MYQNNVRNLNDVGDVNDVVLIDISRLFREISGRLTRDIVKHFHDISSIHLAIAVDVSYLSDSRCLKFLGKAVA